MLRLTSVILPVLLWIVLAGPGQGDEQVRITPDVIYGHKNGMALVMHVYRPSAANGAAIVEIVSGGYFSNWQPPNPNAHLVGRFLKSGYTVFSVFHGSNPKYTIPEIVGDMRLAIRFIRLHAGDYGIDPKRIGAIGSSAGGHLALMLATTGDDGNKSAVNEISRVSSRVAAVVAIAAPSDLRDFEKFSQELLKNGVVNKGFADLIRPAFNFDPKLADSLSPAAQVTPDDAPTMLIHGDADRLVPIDFSHRILAPLQEKQVPCELVVLPGVGHAPTGPQMEKLAQSIERAVAWFDKYLAAPASTAQTGEDLFFDSSGVKIHYVVEGQGEPVILVHGFTGSIQRDWHGLNILARLSQNHQVIALDHRGHGKSEKPFDPKKYGAEMAGDVIRLMDHLNVKKAHVVGYSLGGLITEYLLVHYPDRFMTGTIGGMGWIQADSERMALTAAIAEALETGKGFGPLLERMRPVGKPATAVDVKREMENLLSNNPKALAACARAMPGLAVTEEQLKANQVPALAVIGEIDPLKVTVDDLEKVMSNLKVEVIEGADHGSALSSDKFVDDIKTFLAEHSMAHASSAK